MSQVGILLKLEDQRTITSVKRCVFCQNFLMYTFMVHFSHSVTFSRPTLNAQMITTSILVRCTHCSFLYNSFPYLLYKVNSGGGF